MLISLDDSADDIVDERTERDSIEDMFRALPNLNPHTLFGHLGKYPKLLFTNQFATHQIVHNSNP